MRERCTSTRRVVVQRWPAVPTAPNTIAGTASSRSAISSTMIALLPPSSSSDLAEAARDALADLAADRRGAGERHQRDAPVVDERVGELGAAIDEQLEDRRVACARASPCCRCAGRRSRVSGVFGEGFQTETSPQIAARNAFHAHTATGKLNARMIPTTPSGCHCSYMRCCGRSECMVRP